MSISPAASAQSTRATSPHEFQPIAVGVDGFGVDQVESRMVAHPEELGRSLPTHHLTFYLNNSQLDIGSWMMSTIGRVEAVNVGQPRTVDWHGRAVTTAIWKRPVDGRHRLRGVNIDGDDQADRRVHGGPTKAVYAYTAEDYEWWGAVLGAAPSRERSARTSPSPVSTSPTAL